MKYLFVITSICFEKNDEWKLMRNRLINGCGDMNNYSQAVCKTTLGTYFMWDECIFS